MKSELKQVKRELKKYGYHLEEDAVAIDLVCGMEIKQVERISTYKGGRYYFCSRHCKNHFDANPDMYAGEEAI